MIAALAACAPTAPAGLNSPEPAKRRAAILEVMERGDTTKTPDLVRLLESDDAPTRMLAAAALERITGERFEYDFAATPAERRAGVEQWRRHVESRRAGEGK